MAGPGCAEGFGGRRHGASGVTLDMLDTTG